MKYGIFGIFVLPKKGKGSLAGVLFINCTNHVLNKLVLMLPKKWSYPILFEKG